MTTRIRYYQKDGFKISQDFQVLDKIYYVKIYDEKAEAGLCYLSYNGNLETCTMVYAKNLHILKKKIKAELIKLGVKFDQEIRRKRSQQEAIEKALGEK